MGFVIPIAIAVAKIAAVSIAVQKVAQAISGQSFRATNIPIIPGIFSIDIGAGKPTYNVGLTLPLTKSGSVGISFGVQVGSGRKPSWNVGVNLSKKVFGESGLRFTVKPEMSWTGGEFKKGTPEVSVGLKKYMTDEDIFKENPAWKVEAKWSKEKFSINAGMKNGEITLTKPKKSGVTVDLDVLYRKVIDKKTGREMKLAAGIKFGKGKPIYKLSSDVDLNKQYKIELDKTFGSEVNNIAISLSRYKLEEGKRIKIAQKGTFKYNENTKTPTFMLEGKEMIPVSFNIENKKLKNVIIDTDAVTKYIADKLVPYPEDISWQKKIGQLIEEPILKGVKLVSGEKIPDKVMQFLITNFGGAKATAFKRAIPQDWKNFVEGYAFPKTPEKLTNWQVDLMKQYTDISGIPGSQIDVGSLIEKIKNPGEANLLNSMLKGQISLKDYLTKTQYNVRDLEEKYYDTMKVENQLSSLEHTRNFLKGDPLEVGNAIKELFDKQPEGKAKVLELYNKMPDTEKHTIFSAWQNMVNGLKNIARGIPASIDLAGKLLTPTDYEEVTIGGQTVKIPTTRYWQTPEGMNAVKDYAKNLLYAVTVAPYERGVKVAIEAGKIATEHPVVSFLTGGIYPTAAGLWRIFSEDPVGSMIDASMVASNLKFFSQQARFTGAITRSEAAGLSGAGLAYEGPGGFLNKTLDIAQGLEKASELIDPMNLIFKSAQLGTANFLNYQFPELAKSLKRRTDLSDLLAQQQQARIMQLVIAERDAKALQTSLSGFTDVEKTAIRRAMATGDIGSLPTTLQIQKVYDAISQNKYLENVRRRLALETGIMDVEQMKARIWADAEKTYGMTQAQLRAKGFEPSYVPYLAEQTVTGPLKDALSTLKPRFEKEFVGDISTVEKLPLEKAIAKHHIDFINVANDRITTEKFLSYAKQQGFATPWSIGKPLEKGNVIWDPYSYLKKNELAANFNDTFFTRLEQLSGNADDALKATLADYSTLEGSAAKLGELLNPGKTPVFQVPKWIAYEIESNLKNVFNIPTIIERPTAWAKTAYLAGRFGWIVNDFKDNAIRVLLQGGANPNLNLLAEKYAPLVPDELAFHGIGYDLMSQAIVPAASESLLKKALYSNEYLNKAFGKIDAAVDKFWRGKLYSSEFEKAVKAGLLKDYAANFAYRWNELDKITLSTIENWAKNPAAYSKQIASTQQKVMKIIEDTVYDGSKVLPFLTQAEKKLVKTVFLFPEFMIDTMKKAATLGIRYPYQSRALSNLSDMYNQYIAEEGDRPGWLKDAFKIGEDMWLRPTAGTMFDPEWGLLNPNATVNPLMQAAIEYITGKDLRTVSLEKPFGEPLSDPNQLYYFNPLTQKMEIVSKAKTIEEIDKTIEGYQKGILQLLDEISTLKLSGPEIQARLKRIDQAQRMINQVWQPQKEMYEAGVPTIPETPSFMELYLRKLPQWKILEDALQPYTKYDTSTLLEPKVILDKRTGQPKHAINVWLETLRLLGASVFEYDVDEWRERQTTLKKAQQTVTFGQFISRIAQDDPEMLAKIREDIISGNIPLDWKELPWHEEIEERFGLEGISLKPFEMPSVFDLETQIVAIEEARRSDKQSISDQAAEAIDNLRFFQPEVLSKMRDTIQAVAEEKKGQIDLYYDQMKRSEQMMRMFDELKSAAALKDRLTQMATPITAAEIIKQLVDDLKTSGLQVKPKTTDITRALSEYLTDSLQKNQAVNFKDVVKDLAEVLGQTTTLTSKALLNALNTLVKIPATVTLAKQKAEWATNRLNELAFIELKKQLTGIYPDTKILAPDLQQQLADDIFKYYLGPIPTEDLFKGIDLLTDTDLTNAIVTINADAEAAIAKINESALPFGNLVIKAVEKKKKETIARVKKTYATKKRMQVLFTADKIAGAKGALEKAIAARKDFLTSMFFSHWKDIYDPNTIKTSSGNVPISAMLLALGAARLEIINQFGKSALDGFLTSEEGSQYAQFEKDVLSDYANITEPSAQAFYDNYVGFMDNPSKASFNYIKGLHSGMISDKTKMPVFYRDTKDNNLYATSGVSSWKEEALFSTKLQELDTYSRVYASPEYKSVEKATLKSYTTLSRKLRQGEVKSSWFAGVLLQK